MNLIHNAFKYTPPDGAVTVKAQAAGDRLRLEVADECGGIPASKGDLFEPFGERRGRDRSGLGLGLSLAREAVRAHDGDIHIRNLPGHGCVFSIDLPLALESVTTPASTVLVSRCAQWDSRGEAASASITSSFRIPRRNPDDPHAPDRPRSNWTSTDE